MSGGLLALLDDVAAIAKVAAASLDDIGAQAVKAGGKAAGIVIDDAAVTPRYVVGFAASRELPIVARIAVGSLKNKLLFLLPAAIALSAFAPWAITPLLMIGGAYLCFEGYEKVHELLHPHDESHKAAEQHVEALSSKQLEDQRVAGAIRTDMILSAEIMAISLSTITAPSILMQAVVLAAVAILVTVAVYGAVALIVKADDAGVALALNWRPVSTRLGLRPLPASSLPTAADKALTPFTRGLGEVLVRGMPAFLKMLSLVGTLAMLWVGGGIIVHGAALMGWAAPEHLINSFAAAIGGVMPVLGGLIEWFVAATAAGIIGLAIGWVVALAVARFK